MPKHIPPFHGNINFNAQHSPVGAFMSFTCGHFGTRGGFGLEIGKPGDQNLYIGIKQGDRFSDAPLKVLPFFEGAVTNEAARYDVERPAGPAEANVKPKLQAYQAHEIQRHYGWATDAWVTEDFEFAIYTPFFDVAEPNLERPDQLRRQLRPAIGATFTIDNRHSATEMTAVFAMGWASPGARVISMSDSDDRPDMVRFRGFAWKDQVGVLAQVQDQTSAERLRELSRLRRELHPQDPQRKALFEEEQRLA